MKEYRMTDGTNIIIEIARTEQDARESGAKRLECAKESIQILEVKRRPLTKKEVYELSRAEKYLDYLLRIQRQIDAGTYRPPGNLSRNGSAGVCGNPSVSPAGQALGEEKKSAPTAATERDAEQITLHII